MRSFLEFLAQAVIATLVAQAWFVEPYAVVSGSMTPTLNGPHRAFRCTACGARNVRPAEMGTMLGRRTRCAACGAQGPAEDELAELPGDRVLVDRTAFWFRPPRRWQVVAFRLPFDPGKTAVKRIVGLPGETVELRGGRVMVDGRPLEAPLKIDYETGRRPPGPAQWKLADDEYLLLGDQPELSIDARHWGDHAGIAARYLVGRPVFVHCPYREVRWYGRSFHVPDVSAIRYIR